MADVVIDPAAVEAMFADWTSCVGEYVAQITDAVEATAKSLAPVSRRGSRWAPPGTLKSQVHSVYSHGADGSVQGLVGVSRSSTKGYPLNFVWNATGKTRNANQYGLFGSRRADNAFLFEALNTAGRLF
jgi:hypothetical protein